VQIEQVLVANGLGAVIAQKGMYGYLSEDVEEGSKRLAERAKEIGKPISDFLLNDPKAKKKFPAGVFITAEYADNQARALKYLKLGEGPFYTLIRNYHLCHLEIPKTIHQVLNGNGVLLDNSQKPTASVCVIAKKELEPGTLLRRIDRNFLIRGEAIAIKEAPQHVPIGLMSNVRIKRHVKSGQMLTFDDVEIGDTPALEGWKYTLSLAN